MTLDCLDLLSTASADKRLSKDINVIGVEKKQLRKSKKCPFSNVSKRRKTLRSTYQHSKKIMMYILNLIIEKPFPPYKTEHTSQNSLMPKCIKYCLFNIIFIQKLMFFCFFCFFIPLFFFPSVIYINLKHKIKIFRL